MNRRELLSAAVVTPMLLGAAAPDGGAPRYRGVSSRSPSIPEAQASPRSCSPRTTPTTTAVTVHEWYFGNLGGVGKQSGALAKALPATWKQDFRSTSSSLGGGSGWVTLSLHTMTGELLAAWSGSHTQAPAGALPLLVLDMFEHSYALDHSAAAAKYTDAFFANLKWEKVERRGQATRVLRTAQCECSWQQRTET